MNTAEQGATESDRSPACRSHGHDPKRQPPSQQHAKSPRNESLRSAGDAAGALVRVVGCGRWSMGNDQAGLLVARRLHERALDHVVVDASEQPAVDLPCEGGTPASVWVVVDCAPADAAHPSGTFTRIDYARGPNLRDRRPAIDTHTLSVAAGLELAARLGVLAPIVWIYVLFCGTPERRLTLDPSLEESVAALAGVIERDILRWRAEGQN